MCLKKIIERYSVSCPVCRKLLFKSADSDTDIRCMKCNSDLHIVLTGRNIYVEVVKPVFKESHVESM